MIKKSFKTTKKKNITIIKNWKLCELKKWKKKYPLEAEIKYKRKYNSTQNGLVKINTKPKLHKSLNVRKKSEKRIKISLEKKFCEQKVKSSWKFKLKVVKSGKKLQKISFETGELMD